MSELTFVSYGKIAERLDVDAAAQRALARVPWMVTEKVHGANLAFVSNGQVLRAAKRKELLAEGDEFFGWTGVVERLGPSVRQLARRLIEAQTDATHVIVYGELFGGGYPHPEVAVVDGVEPVQTGVWYAPGIEWRAFDVAVVRVDDATMLDWEAAQPLLAAASVPYLEPLLVGKMNEAENYALGFETRIPAQLGLPRLPDNRAEGVVIKPLRAVLVDGEPVAPRLKRKLAEFAEDERFHGAQKWSPRRAGQAARGGGAVTELTEAVLARINEPRLQAARSKIGRIGKGDRKRRAELLDLVVSEVLDEVATQRAGAWQRLAEVERAGLHAQATTAAETLIARLIG